LLPGDQKLTLLEALDLVQKASETLNLDFTLAQLPRLREIVNSASTYGELILPVQELRMRMHDELKIRLFLYVPPVEAKFYNVKQPFGAEVETKFAEAISDIEESGDCIAVGRSTAAVFHLMRVMERAVQSFGTKLGVANATEKNWQNILDEMNKAIKGMPDASVADKAKKSDYATATANLFNVKLAWRNPVMHPKESYGPEEAVEIYENVKTFMRHLAIIL
jgi:hypothetical protein